jgi:hypothetical protein
LAHDGIGCVNGLHQAEVQKIQVDLHKIVVVKTGTKVIVLLVIQKQQKHPPAT